MGKKRKTARSRSGLQAFTLCISTAMVLILLGLVVFTVLTGRNLSSYMKESLVVTMMLDQDMTNTEAMQMCKKLQARPYINNMRYVSKEQALKDGIEAMGADPTEFAEANPFLSSVELTLSADYANTDSLKWIAKELKAFPKVKEITYPEDLIDAVNKNIAKISLVLLVLAVLLTFVSFSLISASFLHPHHEVSRCLVGIHPSSLCHAGLLGGCRCRAHCLYRAWGVHLCLVLL